MLQDAALAPATGATFEKTAEGGLLTLRKGGREKVLKITASPFKVELLFNGNWVIKLNSANLLQFEQTRTERNPKPVAAAEGEAAPQELADKDMKFPYDVDGMWTESWGSHSDSKPQGPQAVAMDISFASKHVYGIPEHASSFALKTTDGSAGGYNEPYRLYNLDVFEYELDVPMALYGAVPYMIAADEKKTSAVFWLNAAETFIDLKDVDGGKQSHWISETGVIDVFLMVRDMPKDVFEDYAALTGLPFLPPRFAVAYHQCRWNYKNEEDVAQVDGGFDEHDIPYDVIWLDIEHTDGKKYFTWDKSLFPNPIAMQEKIGAKGRKMVTIIDPHIKRDSGYHVHSKALSNDYYVKNKDGNVYEGHCWPGGVSYLDFARPEVREYWASLFALSQYAGSTPFLFTWNDMNEPSVFNGPEVSMPKDCTHLNGKVEHRTIHNMYGFYHHTATAEGLQKRDQARPFVLTRSFFAGSQRTAAVWTGDNTATWSHLEAATPMLLSMNVAGISFSGADVGGFFGNPQPELLLRWYQSAAFTGFFRGHAHIDAARREPWLFGEPWTGVIRAAIRQRYAYLPYIYTVFHQAATKGLPVMRPLWLEFKWDPATFAEEKVFLLGDSLLVVPVVSAGALNVTTYLPRGTTWYEVQSYGKSIEGGKEVTLDAPLYKIPVLQRGGSIVAKRERARRSSTAMEDDPFTLVVAINPADNSATGELYYDDGRSFNYQKGAFLLVSFEFSRNTLKAVVNKQNITGLGFFERLDPFRTEVVVERVVFFGLRNHYQKGALTQNGKTSDVLLLKQGDSLVLRNPQAKIADDWSVTLIDPHGEEF